MAHLTLRQEGDRIYIHGKTYHLRERLGREAGARFDPVRRKLWVPPDKREAARAIVDQANAAGANDLHQEAVHGIASYRGEPRLVLWHGTTRRGPYKYHLCDLAATKAHWAGPEVTEWRQRFTKPVPVRALLGELAPPEQAPLCADCGQAQAVAEVVDAHHPPAPICRDCLLADVH